MKLHTAVNGRLRILMPTGVGRVIEFQLDGWPLLLVDLDEGCICANDLRATHAFSHVGHLLAPIGDPAVDSIGGSDDQTVLVAVGNLVGSIRFDPTRPTHTEVRAVQMDDNKTEHGIGVVLDCDVRYRQLPQQAVPVPVSGCPDQQ